MGVEHYRRRAAVTTTTKSATTTTADAVSKPRSSAARSTPLSPPPAASQELDNNARVLVLLESFDAKLLALEREQWDVIAAMQKVAYGSPDRGINRRKKTTKKGSSTTSTTVASYYSRGGRRRSMVRINLIDVEVIITTTKLRPSTTDCNIQNFIVF